VFCFFHFENVEGLRTFKKPVWWEPVTLASRSTLLRKIAVLKMGIGKIRIGFGGFRLWSYPFYGDPEDFFIW